MENSKNISPQKHSEEVQSKASLRRKIIGIFLIIIGFLALITPFTPGSWLIFVGIGMLGARLIFKKKNKKV